MSSPHNICLLFSALQKWNCRIFQTAITWLKCGRLTKSPLKCICVPHLSQGLPVGHSCSTEREALFKYIIKPLGTGWKENLSTYCRNYKSLPANKLPIIIIYYLPLPTPTPTALIHFSNSNFRGRKFNNKHDFVWLFKSHEYKTAFSKSASSTGNVCSPD